MAAERDESEGWVLRVLPIGEHAGKRCWLCLAPRGSPAILTGELQNAQIFASRDDAEATADKVKALWLCPELKVDAAKGGPLRFYDPDPDEGLPPSRIKRAPKAE